MRKPWLWVLLTAALIAMVMDRVTAWFWTLQRGPMRAVNPEYREPLLWIVAILLIVAALTWLMRHGGED